ncbi:hypothetical protein HYS72_01180 [Candidatus Pacearchaeota archaeon]|nr:hypothetical protein [Candidatus Pacearchaeota archaeon]
MTIKFCKKCKSLLDFFKKKNKVFYFCNKCKIGGEVKDKNFLNEIEKEMHEKETGKGVIKDKNIFATYPFKCKKCGYDKAEIIDQGVKYSDEESEILFQCGKCGWSERINKKSS